MGSAQSYLSSETTLTAVVIAGALGLGYHQYNSTSNPPRDLAGSTETSSKKAKKKRKAPEDKDTASQPLPSTSQPQAADLSNSIPGQFEAAPLPPSKTKKPKKKKTKATAESTPTPPRYPSPPPSSTQPPRPQQPSTTSIDTDGSWTRVEARRRAGYTAAPVSPDITTSDAGITTPVSGDSSPVDDGTGNDRKTLAEKLVPKPPKTKVDDLLETPAGPSLARVMRVQPLPSEKPAPGFSWDDYENVHVADGGGNDADGEDDGWGVVKSKRSRPKRDLPVAEKAPAALTQKQRQNAQKREAQKAAKAAAEAERLATLAKHKRELERARILEQTASKGKKSGGMTSVVDERGKLVWE